MACGSGLAASVPPRAITKVPAIEPSRPDHRTAAPACTQDIEFTADIVAEFLREVSGGILYHIQQATNPLHAEQVGAGHAALNSAAILVAISRFYSTRFRAGDNRWPSFRFSTGIY